jgi:CheY-like chemotaxis protein
MAMDQINLLLADDDLDDNTFFKDALAELPVNAILETVIDGVELMHYLTTKNSLPDVLFLDLNMPRKNGFECLTEIRNHDKLKALPVIIFSTSFNPEVVDSLYESGAHYYIRKPGDFRKLRNVIHKAILITSEKKSARPARAQFVIQD